MACLESLPDLPIPPCNWRLLLPLSWNFSCLCFCRSLVTVSNHPLVPRNVKKTLKVTPASGWRALNILCFREANSDCLGNPLGTIPNGLVKFWAVQRWRIRFYHLDCLQGSLPQNSFFGKRLAARGGDSPQESCNGIEINFDSSTYPSYSETPLVPLPASCRSLFCGQICYMCAPWLPSLWFLCSLELSDNHPGPRLSKVFMPCSFHSSLLDSTPKSESINLTVLSLLDKEWLTCARKV